MTKIRLGLVRCDGHAHTYAPLMARCDVQLYRENCHCEYYWMVDAYRPDRLKTPKVSGFEIVKVWDYVKDNEERFAATYFGKPQVCRTLREVAEGVDAVFICDCNTAGEDHLKLARPFLERGIPTFVDKPFADCLRNARAMVRLARRHSAPLYSSSILREVNEIQHLQARLPEIRGDIAMGVVRGISGSLAATIHGLSLAQGFFGEGVESVECIGDTELEHILLHYRSGVQVTVLNTPVHCFDWFMCDVYTNPGKYMNPPLKCHLRSNTIGDAEYIGGAISIIRKFKRMVQTHKPPLPYESLLELMAIVEAARTAQETRKRIYLKTLR